VRYVVDAITAVDPDVVALQEIESTYWFGNVRDQLDGWDGYRSGGASGNLNLAVLWDTTELTVEPGGVYEYVPADDRPFPRRPLVIECRHGDKELVIIVNHLKCCGDGSIDEDDPWDEETRRRDACVALQSYIETEFPGERVILLGDLNDELTDPPAANVFENFLTSAATYRFADLEIAEGPASGWSYPSWPSHLDHILITAPLFSAFDDTASLTATILLDDYLRNGIYGQMVSDHRPVVLRLKL
jgi:endonuclease/exonuclease/phosphatase family metal-dependent hydrolase